MDKTVEYVLEVARCGGIAKAARNLYITPSALSKFIIQKEEEIGVSIFNREGNKFSLTFPGERYVEMLKEEAALQEKMRTEMARLADMFSGRMRVGFQMSFASFMTKEVLPALQAEYPEIHVFLEEAGREDLIRLVKKKQLDIVLTTAEEKEEDLRYDRILDSPVVIAAALESELKHHAESRSGFSYPWISDGDILSENVIFDRGERSFRKYAGYLFSHEQKPLHSEITVTNARTALLCVEQGMGIIAIPEILVRALGYADRVVMYSYGTEERTEALYAVSDPRSVLTYEQKQFGDIVRKLIINL